jgi:hypothetical protein
LTRQQHATELQLFEQDRDSMRRQLRAVEAAAAAAAAAAANSSVNANASSDTSKQSTHESTSTSSLSADSTTGGGGGNHHSHQHERFFSLADMHALEEKHAAALSAAQQRWANGAQSAFVALRAQVDELNAALAQVCNFVSQSRVHV